MALSVLCLALAWAQVAADVTIAVVGAVNVDVTMQVNRLPRRHETLMATSPAVQLALGGKGANQAVAAARQGARVRFLGRFGNDSHGPWLQQVLIENGVDTSACEQSALPSGQGMVMLDADGGASSVVVPGANSDWGSLQPGVLQSMLQGAAVLLLQREIPEAVNVAAAKAAKVLGITVMQDVGGEDGPLSEELLGLVDFISPNENELHRLTGLPTATRSEVLAAARSLNCTVLVTLGERGALLITEAEVLDARAFQAQVVDATAAGDAFRAAFAVALSEGQSLQSGLRLASAAGAIAVSRRGAEPSLPRRHECEALLRTPPEVLPEKPASASLGFASRLNSMRERLDLWGGATDTLGLVARQGQVRGLGAVYFNFPQHLAGLSPSEVLAALAAANLKAGGIALRFPESMRLGAFTNPDANVRRQAVDLTIQGCAWADALGAEEVVVWPQFDGYDYQLQIDYTHAWSTTVASLREVLDSAPCRSKKVSYEFKPTDAVSRFSLVPSTGAALLLLQEVDRANLGLTLDVGHLLMAGENPAQSVAMVGAAGKLFGIHLNDGHSRLGAEDGLIFGSVHGRAALELVFWLQKTRYAGSIYFDTFPTNEDPVREAELNIRQFQKLAKVAQTSGRSIDPLLQQHDALGVLELMEA
ncbi:unnamed protein product [Effrenium voratum]|nr:unnamed protein product [Effrenium voratum]